MQPWHSRLPFAALPVGSDSWAAQKRDLIHQETKFHFNPSVENEHGIPGPVWVHFPTQPPIQEELKPCASHHRNAIFSLFPPPKKQVSNPNLWLLLAFCLPLVPGLEKISREKVGWSLWHVRSQLPAEGEVSSTGCWDTKAAQRCAFSVGLSLRNSKGTNPTWTRASLTHHTAQGPALEKS